jgi:hypothetical protein
LPPPPSSLPVPPKCKRRREKRKEGAERKAGKRRDKKRKKKIGGRASRKVKGIRPYKDLMMKRKTPGRIPGPPPAFCCEKNPGNEIKKEDAQVKRGRG